MEKNEKALQEELEQLKAENEKLAAENTQIRSGNTASGVVVKGSYTTQREDEDGNKKKVTVSFVPGAANTRMKDGRIVPSEELIKAAKSKTYKAPPGLQLTHGEAKAWMDHLVGIGYGLLTVK